MKKFLFLALGALCGSTLAAKEPPGLLMPDEILSVQGIETNVYFANVFKTVNPDNYFFQVSCPKGKLMKKFWTVTPEKKDIGTYSWKLTVFDDNGKVAEKTVKLKILPQKKEERTKERQKKIFRDACDAGDALVGVAFWYRHNRGSAPLLLYNRNMDY